MTPIVNVLFSRSVRAKKFGRQFISRAASRIRFLVCSGMDRAAAESFSAAETVPGVSPSRSAIVLSVTLCDGFLPCCVINLVALAQRNPDRPALGGQNNAIDINSNEEHRRKSPTTWTHPPLRRRPE